MSYRVSRDLEYALMALSYMSKRKGACVSAREMTHQLRCPFHPFSRVLQKLVDHKFVNSKQGIKGGYILNKNLEKLSLYQLMSAILPNIEIANCLKGDCNLLQSCNIKSPIYYLNKKFLEFYKTLSVFEILDKGSQKDIREIESKKEINKVLNL